MKISIDLLTENLKGYFVGLIDTWDNGLICFKRQVSDMGMRE